MIRRSSEWFVVPGRAPDVVASEQIRGAVVGGLGGKCTDKVRRDNVLPTPVRVATALVCFGLVFTASPSGLV